MGERATSAGFFGLLAVGVGVCCGLPLLASIGVLGAIAGLGFGSWLIITASAAVTVVGLWHWRQNARECDVPASPEITNYEAGFDDRKV